VTAPADDPGAGEAEPGGPDQEWSVARVEQRDEAAGRICRVNSGAEDTSLEAVAEAKCRDGPDGRDRQVQELWAN
jgi:hypothetical protein